MTTNPSAINATSNMKALRAERVPSSAPPCKVSIWKRDRWHKDFIKTRGKAHARRITPSEFRLAVERIGMSGGTPLARYFPRRPWLQSQEAGASEPLLSHLFDGLDASCSRCRRLSRRRTYLQARCAEPVGAARSPAARPLANLVAWRLRFRQRGDHARGRGARTCLPIQAAPDRQRQTHDREARLRARMGV